MEKHQTNQPKHLFDQPDLLSSQTKKEHTQSASITSTSNVCGKREKDCSRSALSKTNVIHPGRRPASTPRSIVGIDGKCAFGTFDREFIDMDLLKAARPTSLPDVFNKLKLTLWQAAEVHLKEGILLCAVCDMGFFGKVLMVYFDKETHEVYTFDTTLPPFSVSIAPNLLKGTQSTGKGLLANMRFENNMEKGRTRISGHSKAKGNTIEFDFMLTRLAPPCVVTLPFDSNRPLYTQKDFLKAIGSLTINGKTIHTDGSSAGVLDDHKGYYPRKSHYDWLSSMGRNEAMEGSPWFAFNLTENQSIRPERYNENLIWLESEQKLLPPVHYEKSAPISTFKKEGDVIWKVKDDHGLVDLEVTIQALSPMVLHTGIINIDYYIFFGVLNGTFQDENGTVYPVKNMPVIGEDKTLLF